MKDNEIKKEIKWNDKKKCIVIGREPSPADKEDDNRLDSLQIFQKSFLLLLFDNCINLFLFSHSL